MREVPYQTVLFDGPDEPVTHFFYVTTNSISVKPGMAADVTKRMKNPQFRGHVLICKIPCNCTPKMVGRYRKCERELAWENAHRHDRLPNGEHYRPSSDVQTALRFLVSGDKRGQAVLVWLAKHTRTQVA